MNLSGEDVLLIGMLAALAWVVILVAGSKK